ncbi:MAG TPA: hypothetical protein VFA04_05330 [Bryobacteraceae bacterium]|nr:hypothetical protein [Bryobacteraceae bacterium]
MFRPTALLMVLLLAAPLGFGKAKTGFDGKWVLDGEPGGGDAPKNLVQNIKEKGGDIDIESQFAEPANGIVPLLYLGIMTTKLMLSTDGSERQNQIGPFQMAAKTTLDGNTMKTEWTAMVQGKQVNGDWVRTLSADGKHMTMQVHETTEGQDRQATLNFKRK